MLGPPYTGDDLEHTVATPLVPIPNVRDDNIEEDPEMMEEYRSKVAEEPSDLVIRVWRMTPGADPTKKIRGGGANIT